MGRIARNTDIKKLEFLKTVINDVQYQEQAMNGIADLLTHIIFDEDGRKGKKMKRKIKSKTNENNAVEKA